MLKRKKYEIPPTQLCVFSSVLFSWIKLTFLRMSVKRKISNKIQFRASEWMPFAFADHLFQSQEEFRDWFLEDFFLSIYLRIPHLKICSFSLFQWSCFRSHRTNCFITSHRIASSSSSRLSLIVLRFVFPRTNHFSFYLHNDKYRFAFQFRHWSRLAFIAASWCLISLFLQT